MPEPGPHPIALDDLGEEPLVSILIANYNYSRYLSEAIESALRQTYSNIEVIVCDDGSSDDSRDVAQRFVDRDPRVHLVPKENGGYPTAVNAAYERSGGRVLCILDSDDVFAPDKVERSVDALRDAGMFGHRLNPVNETGSSLGPPVPRTLDRGWLGEVALERGGEGHFAPASGLSFRREVAEILFPLPEDFRRGADGFIARGAQFVTKIAATDDVLALYRIHGSNTTGLWSADVDGLRGFIEDNSKITQACRSLLTTVYGEETARRLKDEDRPSFWEPRLGLKILDPTSSEAAESTSGDLAEKISSRPRRAIWRLLLALPGFAARPLLRFWWGDSRVKVAAGVLVGRIRGVRRRARIGSTSTTSPQPSEAGRLEPMSLPPLPEQPLVSVLIANYNYADYLPDAVQSVLSQTYDNIELVVCDDGSTDGSPALLDELASSSSRIKVVRQTNKRQSAALSNAFTESTGDIVSLLDADDLFTRTKVERLVETFRARPDAGMAIHQMIRIDENQVEQGIYPMGSSLPDGWLGPAAFQAGGYVQWIEAGIMSLRREVAERIFPLPEEAGQFADVILRGAGAMLTSIAAIEEPLALYRLHEANAGNTARKFGLEEMLLRRRRDLEEVQAAYAALQRWLTREHPGLTLPDFESTRPFLERRYVIAILGKEDKASRSDLRKKLLKLSGSMSPALRVFYRVSPLLPRPAFKVGLETIYGQGRLKATAGRVKSVLTSRP